MKKLYLVLSVGLVLLASACGGGSPAQPEAIQLPQSTATVPQPTSPPAPQPTSPPAPQPTSPTGAPAGQADVPLMPDAANVTTATTAEGTSITYQSASDLNTVLTFYQTEMPAREWTYLAEDASIVSGVSAVLYFTRPGQEVTVTLTNIGAGTTVVIAVTGEGTAGSPGSQPTSPPTPQSTLPPGAPAGQADVPLMPDAANVTTATTAEGTSITYQSASDLNTVLTFYQTEMPAREWTYLAEDASIVSGVSAVLYFTRPGQEAAVTLTNIGAGTTVVIAVTGEGTAGSPGSQPTSPPTPQPTSPPTPQPTSPPAPQPTSPPEVQPTSPPGAGRSDIPVMADATEIEITTSGGDYTLTYKSTSSLDTGITFYQTEMPPHGWTYLAEDASIVSGVTAVLYFTKAGEKATVTLTNMGGKIFVEVVIN